MNLEYLNISAYQLLVYSDTSVFKTLYRLKELHLSVYDLGFINVNFLFLRNLEVLRLYAFNFWLEKNSTLLNNASKLKSLSIFTYNFKLSNSVAFNNLTNLEVLNITTVNDIYENSACFNDLTNLKDFNYFTAYTQMTNSSTFNGLINLKRLSKYDTDMIMTNSIPFKGLNNGTNITIIPYDPYSSHRNPNYDIDLHDF